MTTSPSEINDPREGEEPLDPRVKTELEILNQCSSDVNRLEREVDEARGKYQQYFTTCSQQLERLKKSLGRSIKNARPYYELKEKAREAQSEALRSARKFQSANGVYLAAKETISLAELRLMDDKAASLSAAWQEMLNHALLRVTEAEKAKSASEKEHLARAAAFAEIEQQMLSLEKGQKRSIAKAREYFEKKKELELKLQQVKQSIQDLQQAMVAAKGRYSGALRRLETISDCIHEKRRQSLVLMYPREPGVGAEENDWSEQKLPSLSSHDIDGSEDYEDVYEFDDDDDEDCNSIDSDSVFRTRVLTTSLDEEDTSFTKGSKSRGKTKPLKRSQSLPVYTSQLARRHRGPEVLTPLSDREEACPPDGESVGSGTSVGACSVSSVSSQGLHGHSEEQQEFSVQDAQENLPSETSSPRISISEMYDSGIADSQTFNQQASDFQTSHSENEEEEESSHPHSSQFHSETCCPESNSDEIITSSTSTQCIKPDSMSSTLENLSLEAHCPDISGPDVSEPEHQST